LFANNRKFYRDIFGGAVPLSQAIGAIPLSSALGEKSSLAQHLCQPAHPFVETEVCQLPVKFRDEIISSRRQNSFQRFGPVSPGDDPEEIGRQLIVSLRKEPLRLCRQAIDVTGTPTFVALLLVPDKPVTLEETQVAPDTDLRHPDRGGEVFDAHHAILFQETDQRAA